MNDRYQRDYERARAAAPYGDDREVERLTRLLVNDGQPILQSHKLADTDQEHVVALLDYFSPPRGAHVLDVGAGVGAVAAIMVRLRRDLSFTLLNISPAQLRLAPSAMRRVCGHMHELPFADRTFDAAMYNFSLGHGLVDRSLAEASRVVRQDGVVFAYGLAASQPEELVERLGFRPHRVAEVLEAARRHGLQANRIELDLLSSAAGFIKVCGQAAFTRHGFDRCSPVVYRFLKV